MSDGDYGSSRNEMEDSFQSGPSNSPKEERFRGDKGGSPSTRGSKRGGDYGGRGGGSGDDNPEPEQFRKLFIGGLDYKTTEDSLKQYFEQWGEIVDVVVMKDPKTKRSRGFGFITYSNSRMVDAAQAARPHRVDGREVEPKRAVPRQEIAKPEAGATVKKLFVGGLSDAIGEDEMREYFSQFGEVTSAVVVTDKDTGKKRGFGFVEFTDHDPVDKIVLMREHSIVGKRVDVKKALSKAEMANAQRGGGGGGGSDRGFGGGSGRGGRGGGGSGGGGWGGGRNMGGSGGGGWSNGGGGGGYGSSGGGGYGGSGGYNSGGGGGYGGGGYGGSSGGGWGSQGGSSGGGGWGSGGQGGGGGGQGWGSQGGGAGYNSGGGWGGDGSFGNYQQQPQQGYGGGGGGGGPMRSSYSGGGSMGGGSRPGPYSSGGGGGGGGGYGGGSGGRRF